MASQLPTFPRIVFTILEPLSLLSGAGGAILQPAWFISQQIPSPVPVESTEQSRLVAQQLGNCYFILFLVVVGVLSSTSELKVVRSYLLGLWIADIGHIGITALGLGYDHTLAVGQWNAVTWGNIGFTGRHLLSSCSSRSSCSSCRAASMASQTSSRRGGIALA